MLGTVLDVDNTTVKQQTRQHVPRGAYILMGRGREYTK